MWRPLLAEALGTFLLVAVGCGAILTDATSPLGPLGVPLAFGLAVGLGVLAFAPVSQAHFNPAVTLAFASGGHFPWRAVPTYLAAQALGGIVAAWALLHTLGTPLDPTMTRFVPGLPLLAGLAIEALLTFVLMTTILVVATDPRVGALPAGVAIGAAVFLGALVGGPLTGGSMNPARSLAPAMVDGDLGGLWRFFLGPTLGALGAVFLHRTLRRPLPLDDEVTVPSGGDPAEVPA
ncbi:MAG: aquaporin [Euryarchaeota archaeon]|nr:aquaporin [Euryarchaeota archaeon]